MSFTTKDSGARMAFDSGMVRDTQAGKTLYHLLFDGPLLVRWAELLTRGAEKYAEHNWMKANGQAELDRFKASAARHFFQYMRGDRDEDHAAAVVFNLNGAEYVQGKLHAMQDEAYTGEPAASTAIDLDKCGTTDGTTPLPLLGVRFNTRSDANRVTDRDGAVNSHWRITDDGTVLFHDGDTNEDMASSFKLAVVQEALRIGEYILCDENGKAL